MKKIYLLILAALCMVACDQKLDTWSGRDVAYFDIQGKVDSTIVSFAYMNADIETYSVDLFVRYMGSTSQSQRMVAVRVVDEETTAIEGLDYEPLAAAYPVEPGYTYAYFPVVILRNPSLWEQEKYLTIELVENKDFGLLFTEEPVSATSEKMVDMIRHRIYFTELMIEPPKQWFEGLFGKFTPEKFLKICEVAEIPRENFNDATKMTNGRASFTATLMKAYLDEMAAAGTPVLEKDGTPMRMGDNI